MVSLCVKKFIRNVIYIIKLYTSEAYFALYDVMPLKFSTV
jgi:hypothetical protein